MGRLSSMIAFCAALAVTPVAARSQQGVPPRTAPAPQEYVFPSGAGVLFFHVRPDRTQDFEAIVTRLNEVLDRSIDPVRRQQSVGWRVFKSVETPRDAVIYLFFFEPAVFGADYDPVKILSEAAPSEAQALYERLRADVLRVERMGLTKLR